MSSFSSWIDTKFWALLFVERTEHKLVLEFERSLFYNVLGILTLVGGISLCLDTFMFLTKLFKVSVPEFIKPFFSLIEAEDLTEIFSSWSRVDWRAADSCTTSLIVYLLTLSLIRVLKLKGIVECDIELVVFLRGIVKMELINLLKFFF